MAGWLMKTEPGSYGWADLVRDGHTAWDGVRNHAAAAHLRAMVPGDRILIYHSNEGKALVGLAEVARAPYPDPRADDARLAVIDVAARARLPREVALSVIKADPALAGLGLVRQSRLSVVPVTAPEWARLSDLAGLP